MGAIREKPAILPFKFICCSIKTLEGILAHLLILKHVKRYKIINYKNSLILTAKNVKKV